MSPLFVSRATIFTAKIMASNISYLLIMRKYLGFPPSMIFRRSTDTDLSGIEAILRDLDLWCPTVRMKDFWVAEGGGRIVAVARLEEAGSRYFLSALGVIPSFRKQGIASELVERMARETGGEIYLYTIIPGLFERLGFEEVSAPDQLPRREVFECDRCDPDRCVCMVRHCDVS